jgi:hypothetical protein
MRKGTIPGQCDWFAARLTELETLATGLLAVATSDTQKQWSAQMLAVNAWSIFSEFAEWVLYCSINNDSSQLRKTTGLTGIPKNLNLDTVTALFTLERGYYDFHSYGDLIQAGRRFVSEEDAQNPFKKAANEDTKFVDRLAKIRNRVVHESRKSRGAYEAMMRQDYQYRRVPSPGKFLATQDGDKLHLFKFFDALRRIQASIRG